MLQLFIEYCQKIFNKKKKKEKERLFKETRMRRLLARWNQQTIQTIRARTKDREGKTRAKEKRVQLFNAYLPQAACHAVPPFRETKINYCSAVFVARRGAVNPAVSLFMPPPYTPVIHHHLPNIIF